MPRKNIWIPDAEVKEIVKAAKKATEKGGVGAYLVKLHKDDNTQLKELAEAAETMLELLVKNSPLDGLWSSDIDEWEQLIKDGKR